VRLDLSLVSATDGQVVARASLTGPASDITALTDSASWALLRAGWKGSFTAPPSLGEVRTRSLDALRAYLEGEQLVVRGQWEAAESAYVRAMAADTSFLLAYVGYAHSRWWVLRRVDSAVVNRINRNLDRLPEREAFIEHAFRASGPFAGDSLLREATRRWPDWWPGWFWYGDRMIHGGGLSGISREEAIKAFRRAAELNPGTSSSLRCQWIETSPDRRCSPSTRLPLTALRPDTIVSCWKRRPVSPCRARPLIQLRRS
jgi:tetratricopeptide (TPR) repeat protein